jgi:hypothetical protein
MPITGTWPDRRRVAGERADMQAGHDGHVGVARSAASALGKQHHGQLLIQRDAQHAVGLGVVAHALRARQHRGVVSHDHGAAGLGPVDQAVDAADPGHHAVGRSVAHQVVFAAAAALGGHGQRAVFDETAFVAQVGDVLARRALAQRMAFGDRLGAARIERERMAVNDPLQIGAQGLQAPRRMADAREHLRTRIFDLFGAIPA